LGDAGDVLLVPEDSDDPMDRLFKFRGETNPVVESTKLGGAGEGTGKHVGINGEYRGSILLISGSVVDGVNQGVCHDLDNFRDGGRSTGTRS
jgi:hypothetical protein